MDEGSWWTKDMLSEHEQIVVTAICDLYEDRLESVCKALEEKGKPIALCTMDYRELIESDKVDTVFVLSGWDNHFEASIYAMKCGPNQVKSFRDAFFGREIIKDGDRLYLKDVLFGKGKIREPDMDYIRLFTGVTR